MKGLASNLFKYVVVILLTSLPILGFCSTAMAQENPPAASLIVKMVRGLSAEEQLAVIERNGGVLKSSIPQLRMYVVEVPEADVEAVMERYGNDPAVASVELNQTRKVEGVPSDAMLGDQWALPKIGWDTVYGNEVMPAGTAKIAILDTGIDASHPDLVNMVVPGHSLLISGSDGTTDPNGHGTWLAGIVAAQTNNLEGIAGIAYAGVQVMPVQVIGANGEGQDADIVQGVIWAVDNGADVILMGFSNPGFSQALQDAIDYAWENDVVLVAAVGNDALGDPTYPAGDRGVMGVSATDESDAFAAGLSNFGLAVFLAAPGVSIEGTGLDGSYVSTSGTSASSAIVAGVAAFMRAMDPMLTNGVIVGRLARSADRANVTDPAAAVTQVGNGRVNMANALSDTSTEEIQPAGVEGGGGPFVGPYRIAGNSIVSGYVKDSNNNPISGAMVACTSGCNSAQSTTTNTLGYYAFSAAANNKLTFSGTSATLTLTASKTGYTSVASGLTATNGGSYTKDFSLALSCTAPSVTIQPASETLVYGNDVTFTAGASGEPVPTVQWQLSTDGGTNWSNIAGETNATLTLTKPIVGQSGNNFRAVFTNSCSGTQTATSNAAALTVTKANATCTVSGYAGTYDAASHGATGSCSGIEGETAGTLDLGANYKDVPGGTAHWVFTGNGNYKDQSGDVAITITKADATCSIGGYSGVYDAASHGATGSCTGIGGENPGTLDPGASFKNVPGGTAHWILTGNGNYKDQNGDIAITITKADATCTISGYTGVYDAALHGASGSCSGIGGENPGTLDPGANFKNVPGGAAHWIFTGNGNYKDQSGDVTITITKADATCTISGYTGVYDAALHGASGSCTGIGGESAGTLDPGTSFKNVPGGTANWVFTGNSNYKDQSGDVAITITKANPNCSVTGYSGVYNAAYHGANGSCTGIGGESAGTLNLGMTYKDVPGGLAHWVFTGNGNYKDQSGDVAVVISKANASISVASYSVIYDALAHTATGTATGVLGETLSGLDLSGTSHSDPGDYLSDPWTFTDVTGNYHNASGTVHDSIRYQATGICYGDAGHSILQPIDSDGTSVFKQKSTVPAKFRVCDAYGNSVGMAGVVYSFRMIQRISGTVADIDEAVVSTTPDASFRWSPTDQQWIFNMNTKNLTPGSTYVYLITLNDGSTIPFQFGLK